MRENMNDYLLEGDWLDFGSETQKDERPLRGFYYGRGRRPNARPSNWMLRVWDGMDGIKKVGDDIVVI